MLILLKETHVHVRSLHTSWSQAHIFSQQIHMCTFAVYIHLCRNHIFFHNNFTSARAQFTYILAAATYFFTTILQVHVRSLRTSWPQPHIFSQQLIRFRHVCREWRGFDIQMCDNVLFKSQGVGPGDQLKISYTMHLCSDTLPRTITSLLGTVPSSKPKTVKLGDGKELAGMKKNHTNCF